MWNTDDNKSQIKLSRLEILHMVVEQAKKTDLFVNSSENLIKPILHLTVY